MVGEKVCPICKVIFNNSPAHRKYCSTKCYLENKKIYKKGDKYKAWCKEYDFKYRLTDAFKKSQDKYNQSQTRKNYLKVYRDSGKLKHSLNKYYHTPKGHLNMLKHKWKRRAAKMNVIEIFTMKEWKDKAELVNGICPNCKNPFDDNLHKLTLDHVYSLMGAYEDFLKTGIKRVYTINDIQPLCKRCNCKKQ